MLECLLSIKYRGQRQNQGYSGHQKIDSTIQLTTTTGKHHEKEIYRNLRFVTLFSLPSTLVNHPIGALTMEHKTLKRGAAAHGNTSKRITVVIPVELFERLQEYKKGEGITQSEAIRLLLDQGLWLNPADIK